MPPIPTSRVTLHDVAREANVSPATVDRVLNNREGVRARTREVVLSVARRLGYVSDAEAVTARPVTGAQVNLVFLLPSGTNTFIKSLQRQIEVQAAERSDLNVRVESLEGFNPQTVAARLGELSGEVDGVALVAQDHPLVREAIRGLVLAEIPVVTIASDIQNVGRLAYVGIDNRQAGRLAGQLMGRLLGPGGPHKVALFAGSLSYRGHEEREMGFRHILREEFPAVQIVELREIHDDRQRAIQETSSILDAHPDLRGIYNVGAGTVGIAQEIRKRGLAGKIVVIGHEATESNKQLLLEGVIDAVIDQNPRVEVREALNLLSAAARRQPCHYVAPRLQLVLKENLPND